MPIAVAITPEPPAEAAEQENDQDDDEYRSKRHGTLPVRRGSRGFCATGGSKPYSGADVLNRTAEKAAQGLCGDFGRGFREEVPAFDRVSGPLVRPLPPQRERTLGIPAVERAVCAP